MFFQVWYHKADRDGKPVTIPAVGVLCFVDVEGLFRREENHCRIGIVISFASATTAVLYVVLHQQYCVKIEFNAVLFHIRMVQTDNACLWMQRLASQAAVALMHRFDI